MEQMEQAQKAKSNGNSDDKNDASQSSSTLSPGFGERGAAARAQDAGPAAFLRCVFVHVRVSSVCVCVYCVCVIHALQCLATQACGN